MARIYVARHGQDEDNAQGILNGRRNTPLTQIGLGQARSLAQHIKDTGLSITKVYSSPLRRAYTTAEIVSEALALPKPEKLDLLIERDFGIMTGKYVQDIEKLCAPDIIKTDTVTYFLSPEGAESFPALLQRSEELLEWLRGNDTTGDILLICHSDIGKMIYATYYQLDWKEVLQQFHFGNSELLMLSEDSRPEDRHSNRVAQHNH